MLTKVSNTSDIAGRLSPVETRRLLNGLKTKAGRARAEARRKLDTRETAKFIAEHARILRSAAISAGLAELGAGIEETFYSAYNIANANAAEAPSLDDLGIVLKF